MWIEILAFVLLVCLISFVGFAVYGRMRTESDELRARNRELEKIIRQRGLLAREVAHELKNPITAILCSADTLELLLRDKIEPEYLRCFSYIKDYGDSILRLVNDFIDVSLDESGHLRSEPKPVLMAGVLKTVVGLLDSSAQRKSITIEVDIREDIRAVVDPRHFKQITFNLIHNAIKFTPHEGMIRVGVKVNHEHGTVSLIVSDSGVGIEQEDLDSLFDPYAGRSGSNGHPEKGVGLGLPLTHRLVKLARGSMRVESKPGIGTTVEVELPGYEGVSSEVEGRNWAYDLTPLSGQRVLLVDPHTGSRSTVQTLIQALGGTVQGVATAAEAVEALSGEPFSALLIDDSIQMPSVEQLLSKIKNDPKHGMTRVVVARGHTKGTPVSVDAELDKPINGARLLSSLVQTH